MKLVTGHSKDTSPTVRQLASLAGVSRTTISLALRNHPSLPISTRQRIQALAQDHGYHSDAVVSALMTRLRTSRKKRTLDTLAFLTFWKERDQWKEKSENDRRYFAGVCNRAEKLGYQVETFWAKEPGLTPERLSEILYTRAIRGLIMPPLLRSSGHLSFRWDYFAAAAIGYTLVKPDLHRATHSHLGGMVLALRKLKQRGYQRVAFANLFAQDERVRHNWLAGFLTYQQITGQTPIPPLLTNRWDLKEFKKWLNQHRPDAIVSNTLEPLAMLKELGRDVPGEIGYASLDRITRDAPYSGIDQHPEEVGAAAVDLVVTQLHNNELGLPKFPQTLLLDGSWSDGPTVRLPNSR